MSRAASQNESSCPQRMVGLCSKILGSVLHFTQRACQRLHPHSIPTTDISSTGSFELHAQVAKQFVQEPGFVAVSSLILSRSQHWP